MGYFKDILKYEKKYRKFTILNILFNILYAIFNVLSVLAFIPVLKILFGEERVAVSKPIYSGIGNIGSYLENEFNYFISQKIINEGEIIVVPKGVEHCPVTKDGEEVYVLLFEKLSTAHTGNIKHEKTISNYPKI